VDTGTGPGWSLRTPKHSSTLTWTHGDRGGGIARGAHRPGTSHAAAGPGGSRTARTSQHGDPLTQPQGPAPETPRRTTSLRQPSRTRGSQPRELWRYRLLGGDLHALAGARPPPRWSPRRRLPTLARPREPGPNASFPTRWHGDPHTAAGASPPPRATRPPARSRPYALAGAGTPRWDQGHAREADPTRPQGPAHGGGGHRGQRPYAAAGAGLFFLADFRTTTRAADTTIPARIARTKPRKFSMAKNTNTPP